MDLLLIGASLVGVGIIGAGIWAELHGYTLGAVLQGFRYQVRHSAQPFISTFMTLFWLAMLVPLIDHLQDPDTGMVAAWAWSLTIVQHEAGHVICAPFGWFLMVAGGSIWQILAWWLPGMYLLYVRHRFGPAMLMFVITGHSFINMSVYIRDAQERALPLLFGMGPEAHDWGNLLSHLNLLEYDNQIADLAIVTGVVFVLSAMLVGILATWYVPGGFSVMPYRALGNAILQAAERASRRRAIKPRPDTPSPEQIDALFDEPELDDIIQPLEAPNPDDVIRPLEPPPRG